MALKLVSGAPRKQMLRISFRQLSGESPTLMLASCLRFCPDGTLRGADNCVVARNVEGCWQVGGKLHRELECDGPVRVRVGMAEHGQPMHFGPFTHLHTTSGVLYGDDKCLNIVVPGRHPRREGDCAQLTLIWEGANHGQA
jgi:hypothetical protein